ncbi:MAG: hypothetical protein ACI9AP_000721 [Flavobacteriales bacterium]|jgi:hypothetical protein
MKLTKQLFFILVFAAASSAYAACGLLDSSLHKLAVYSGSAITMGVDSVFNGNLQVVTGATLGAGASVSGHVVAGRAVTLSAGASIGSSVVAGSDVTLGAASSVGRTTANNSSVIANHQVQLTDEQARLAAIVAPAANELATTMTVNTILEAGVYHAVALTTTENITLTFDGKGQDGDWLINVDTYISFGASLSMELLNVTDNSTIIWNTGSSTTTGASSDIIGTFFAGTHIITGASVYLKGIGGACGRMFATNEYVTLGADNVIGEPGCTVDAVSPVAKIVIVGSDHPDHFLINHDEGGFHCLAEPVSVTAKYTNGSTATCYTGNITLDTQTGAGDWGLLTAIGSLVDAVDNDGLATYTFSAADNGVAGLSLYYTDETAETFDIDAYQDAIRDNDSEGDITFSASGFTITASELIEPPPNDPISTQIAGTAFDAHITAFGTLPNDSTCGIIETFVGSTTLTLSTVYDNPSSGTVKILSGGSDTATLTFTGGKARLSVKYKDTGQVGLSISDGTISGNSNNFVVKPASFVIEPANSPFTATSPTDTNIYTSAGTDFNITLTAIDSEGSTTPNYGNEIPAETIDLGHALAQPVGGSIGIVTTSLSKTGSGIFSGTANWSEVGIIDLIATVGDATYLGTGNVSTTLSNVGRFTPATLSIEPINQGTFISTNLIGIVPFTYIGQRFSYDLSTRPSFRVTALNALSTATPTVNYTGAWGKLNASSIAFTAPTSDVTQDGTTASTRMVLTYVQDVAGFRDPTITANQPAAVNGIFDATFTNDDFTYDKDSNSQISPFNPSVNLLITSVTDSDGISSGPITLNPTGTDPIRFGRMRMYNANGSELSPLVMDYRLEYFDSGNWGLHDDMDSTIATGDITSNPAGTSGTSILATTLAGKFAITLAPPGTGNDKAYLITTDVFNSGEPWLQYDWDSDGNQDGSFDDNPSATATFGIYQGNTVNIYIQQTYQ